MSIQWSRISNIVHDDPNPSVKLRAFPVRWYRLARVAHAQHAELIDAAAGASAGSADLDLAGVCIGRAILHWHVHGDDLGYRERAVAEEDVVDPVWRIERCDLGDAGEPR
jgi:hypothetical protein